MRVTFISNCVLQQRIKRSFNNYHPPQG